MSNDFQPSTLKFILLMAALRESSLANPKNSNDLIRDVEIAYKELCPDGPTKRIAPATIIRHIKTINKSGYMKINTCKNLKDGYYCDSQLFTAAEFSLIAQALYRSPSLSTKETKTLLNKFLNHIDDSGENYLDILAKQIARWSPKRKTPRSTLPNIEKITYAIWHQKEIAFHCYDLDNSNPENLKVRADPLNNKPIEYRVSPYFLVWDNDECYLIAYAPPQKGDKKFLSHFLLTHIADDVRLLGSDNYESIKCMQEYPRYRLDRTLSEQKIMKKLRQINSQWQEERLDPDKDVSRAKFSLDRYMRENPFMYHSPAPVIDIKLHYPPDCLGTILKQFNLSQQDLYAYDTGNTYPDGTPIWSAMLTLQPNKGFYMWLFQQGGRVTVVEPKDIRDEMKKRLAHALAAINAYEKSPDDPISPEDVLVYEKKSTRYKLHDFMEKSMQGLY